MNIRMVPVFAAALALAFPLTVKTNTRATDNDDSKAPQDVIVNFGDPVTLAGAANQVLVPNDTAVHKGGTVTFVVNGGGHGIALYPVSKNTTREELPPQLSVHEQTTNARVHPTFANGDHTIRHGKDRIVTVTGTNPPFQRVDDPTDRLLATSTQLGGVPGVFLTGTTATTVGTQLQFRFAKTGRYLAVCMNRGHFLANWMFGFISVVGNDD